MALKVQNGYQVFQDNEPLILEPEDWSIREWATLCKLCGLPLGQTERIVLHANKLECYVDLNKEAFDSERTFTVTEVCPHCEKEIEMRWNTSTMGFKAFCPVCGKRLMLCDVCRHTEGNAPCDYDNNSDSCHRNPIHSKQQDKVIDSMTLLQLETLMAKYEVCIRAIPYKIRSVVEVRHADQYPDGKIVFLPEFKREMLVAERVPEHAGQFLIEKGIGTSSIIRFTGRKFYDTLEDVISELTGRNNDGT